MCGLGPGPIALAVHPSGERGAVAVAAPRIVTPPRGNPTRPTGSQAAARARVDSRPAPHAGRRRTGPAQCASPAQPSPAHRTGRTETALDDEGEQQDEATRDDRNDRFHQ
ncbi:hypothetical protein FHS42_001869 [Streptomyces zagrosensis]|uniref:Uncharacterized protein n=1 Tax=Streptomyces zagrosensis TaxID=1042984 RepID=A0A7W9Q972_9ACTN|nr:hypothetical protein [Streptomyces zagrosensis]